MTKEKFNLENIAMPSVPCCSAVFEFGIAESDGFDFLDDKELNRLLTAVDENPFQVMDVLCIICYYKTDKKKPLKFDYYMLRFLFGKNSVEVGIFHQKGPRHITPDETIDLIARRVNAMSSKAVLKLRIS